MLMSELRADLSRLSSAEDFFDYFGLSFDARVLAASRLHILKRFHDYLSRVEALEILSDAAQRDEYRAQLARAYADFAFGLTSASRNHPRIPSMRGTFVALSSVRLPKTRPF